MKKVSLKDIAQQLGVSTASVSLVLNGKEKEVRINEDTARRIKQLASKLGYRPNLLARSLKNGKSNILGLVVADISNPFFASLARHIEDEAAKYNYTVIFGSSDENTAKLESLLLAMSAYRVDGFIVAPDEKAQSLIQQLKDNHRPVTLIDRYFSDLDTSCIYIDNYKFGAKAASHLCSQQCQGIAGLFYASKLEHLQERERGFNETVQAQGVDNAPKFYIRIENIAEDTQTAIKTLLQNHPNVDGIFFSTDTIAKHGISELIRQGISLPGKYKLLSFDENEIFNFLNFPVPHFAQPLDQMGREAVKNIIAQIENKSTQSSRVIVEPKWFDR